MGTLTEREWDGKGTMPSPERLVRADRPARTPTLRWFRLVVAAVVAGALVTAAIRWSGALDELSALAAGATGALVVGSVMWMRRGYTFSDQMGHAESGWSALHTEVSRSRRHERQFTLVGIPEVVWGAQVAHSTERTTVGLTAAASLQTLLRTPDRAWMDDSLLYVLLTDCDRGQAEAFLKRVRAHVPQLFPATGVRVAVFPEDGVTVGALMDVVGAVERERTTEALAS